MTDTSSTAQYDALSDTWHLTHLGGVMGVEIPLDGSPLPEGDFTVVATVTQLPADSSAGVGLVLMDEDAPQLYLLASLGNTAALERTIQVVGADPVHLMIEYIDGVVTCSQSSDGVEWEQIVSDHLRRPTRAGLVLRYSENHTPVTATVAHFRILDGPLQPEATVLHGLTGSHVEGPPSLFFDIGSEPVIHAVMGAQFGDREFDVGKSIRWLMWFTDRHFILDVNLGDTRYYVVNWALTFPEAKSGVTDINYFRHQVDFRKEQFARAAEAWNFDDNDWVFFCDAHEGFSVDDRSLPDDWALDPFKSYFFREVARATAAGHDRVCVPYFAFVKHGDIQNVEYIISNTPTSPVPDTPVTFSAIQPIAVPFYIPDQGLVRFIKVSALRNPAFDWTSLDTPSTPDVGCKIQIISYGHAHWNPQDVIPPATEPEAINATNDEGWKMRQLISMVRPVTGLPYADPWKNPSLDDAGVPGPTADTTNYNPIVLSSGRDPVAPNAAVIAIRHPLYDTVFRINLRDGVWYEGNILGNVPLAWNETTQKWEPTYPPDQWHPDNFATVF